MARHALYYSPGACSLAAHVVLEEIGEPFEARRVTIAEGENFKPEYLAINPRGFLPALEVEGQILTESPAILAYLASTEGGRHLAPERGTVAYGQALRWLAWISGTLHVAYARFWRSHRFLPPDADATTLIARGREDVIAACAEIEATIGEPWALGEAFSVVDANLLPFYRWGVRIGLDMDAWPRWTALTRETLKRPAVRRALATEQPTPEWGSALDGLEPAA